MPYRSQVNILVAGCGTLAGLVYQESCSDEKGRLLCKACYKLPKMDE
jgi:hypothetical protein